SRSRSGGDGDQTRTSWPRATSDDTWSMSARRPPPVGRSCQTAILISTRVARRCRDVSARTPQLPCRDDHVRRGGPVRDPLDPRQPALEAVLVQAVVAAVAVERRVVGELLSREADEPGRLLALDRLTCGAVDAEVVERDRLARHARGARE